MSYQKGSTILASDITSFLATVNEVYGTGNTDRGYGQSTITQLGVSVGDPIRASHWLNLVDITTVCGDHQGTDISSLPPTSAFVIGDPIIAHEQASPSLNAYELSVNVSAIDTNRLIAAIGSMTLATNVWSIARSGSWTPSITTEVSMIWASEDAARFYFNSGGQIRMSGSQPGSSYQDLAWNDSLVNGVGLVKFGAHDTTNTGSYTGSVVMGYYELTDTYQTVYHVSNAGGYHFSNEDILIQAKRLNYIGTNGGNGNGVQFSITLTDSGLYTANPVDSGTVFQFDNLKATTYLTGILSPTYTTVTAF